MAKGKKPVSKSAKAEKAIIAKKPAPSKTNNSIVSKGSLMDKKR